MSCIKDVMINFSETDFQPHFIPEIRGFFVSFVFRFLAVHLRNWPLFGLADLCCDFLLEIRQELKSSGL